MSWSLLRKGDVRRAGGDTGPREANRPGTAGPPVHPGGFDSGEPFTTTKDGTEPEWVRAHRGLPVSMARCRGGGSSAHGSGGAGSGRGAAPGRIGCTFGRPPAWDARPRHDPGPHPSEKQTTAEVTE